MTTIEEPTATSLLKPIRAFQLMLTIFLYHLSIYLISIPVSYMGSNSCLLLMVTSNIYICITGGSIMTQKDGEYIEITSMFAFCLLGIPLFIVVGLMSYAAPLTVSSYWAVKTILLFCFLLAAAFLIEILMVLPISRKNKRIMAQNFEMKQSIAKEEPVDPPSPPAEPAKRDLTTSVSSLRLPPDADETATPDHSYRKVSFGRRREYVDSPTSVPSMAAVKIAEIQTEPKRVSVEGSQTCKCELKEVLVQTVSRCEFCNQQMQAGTGNNQQAAICGPPCPTVVQLLHGGIALPFCTNCSCTAGIFKVDQQNQPQAIQYQKQEQSQPQQLEYPKEDKPESQPQLEPRKSEPRKSESRKSESRKSEQSQPQQLPSQKEDKPRQSETQTVEQPQPQPEPEPQQLEPQVEEVVQPQQEKVAQKTQHVQLEEPRVQRAASKESNRGNGSQPLTSFTKVTVTAFCTAPNATTMEVATSRGSKENVVTTYIPPQATVSTEIPGRPQIVTTSQQTEKTASYLYSKYHKTMEGHGREFESSKEEAIFASECYEMEKRTGDDEEYLQSPAPPPQTTFTTPLKSDDDDAKSDIKKKDSKESRQCQTPKTSKDTTPHKARRGRESATPTKHLKRTKRSSGATTSIPKEKKDDCRTYSRFLPLEDVKPRDPRCAEQNYDLSNICIPIHTHEVIEFQPCSRTIPSVFQRNNRIDPVCIPECDNYGNQTDGAHFQCTDDRRYQCTDNRHFQCETDTPAEMCTTHPVTTATTDTDICLACRKEQVHFPQADIFQYYNVYKDKEARVYCNTCAPPHSDKAPIIIDRSEAILQECSICGNFPYIIDARSVGAAYKHEERSSYCIKCCQLQM